MSTTLDLWVRFTRSRYYPWRRIAATRKTKPSAAQLRDEGWVRLQLTIDDRIFDPPTAALDLGPEHVARPAVSA